jgi:hypothetical protein
MVNERYGNLSTGLEVSSAKRLSDFDASLAPRAHPHPCGLPCRLNSLIHKGALAHGEAAFDGIEFS